MAATPNSPATLATFLNGKGFVCTAMDLAPTVGGTVAPVVIGKTPGNRAFAILWGTAALAIAQATVTALFNGGIDTLLAHYTATEIVLEDASTSAVIPPLVSTPGVSISTDDPGLLADILAKLNESVPPTIG